MLAAPASAPRSISNAGPRPLRSRWMLIQACASSLSFATVDVDSRRCGSAARR